MIVVDASVLIAHTVIGHVHATAAHEILARDDEFAAHPMTLAEYLVGPVRAGRETEGVAAIRALGVQQSVPASEEPLTLARLRASTGLRLPDCCVLAAASSAQATVATFDRRLATSARALRLLAIGTD